MKTEDYINSLIKEKEDLKELCKSHVKDIFQLKHEIARLNNIILIKDKKLKEIENTNIQNELEFVKNELNTLREDYAYLQNVYDEGLVQKDEKPKKSNSELKKLKAEYKSLKKKYEDIVKENEELKSIFDEVERDCGDSN